MRKLVAIAVMLAFIAVPLFVAGCSKKAEEEVAPPAPVAPAPAPTPVVKAPEPPAATPAPEQKKVTPADMGKTKKEGGKKLKKK